ncbi:hypothetical protein GWK08_05720 [Leptobacterium flavescens]|uniref:Carboxypeptidase-like regulatory domain-containing protein n=1 Tax=Leptobacterium flavescens TaxID=472055 RepID=A0A6P0UIW9_9FLAO|nr:carboxypeptidase-like regulatory domain-containing protein [Leptobacterium flavescens]NER12927.1 hypothetical protein [Leptobacterium flavescens]
MKRILLVFFLISSVSFSQRLSGYVYDKANKEPLFGVSVYFDGTTIGTITDENGFFSLSGREGETSKSNYKLVISHLGYFDKQIKNVETSSKLEIFLNPKSISLKGVTLKADPFSREEKLKIFKDYFLGKTGLARYCKIKNVEDVYLYFDVDENILKADADVPIYITNDFLGYELRYNLQDFFILFSRKTLDPKEVVYAFRSGTTFFVDKKGRNDYFEKRRSNIYDGSIKHFMIALYYKSWEQQGYVLRGRSGRKIKNNVDFYVSGGVNEKLVSFDKFLTVRHNRRSSLLELRDPSFVVDRNGTISPPMAVIFKGYMGDLGLADALPDDYSPTINIDIGAKR